MKEKIIEKFRILHVDDNVDALKLFQLKMRSNFLVTTTSSAKEAMEILEDSDFDAVITDYEMPRTNGLELLKMIRQKHPQIPRNILHRPGETKRLPGKLSLTAFPTTSPRAATR